MPRHSRLRLVPITTLIACALPCAGASAAPADDPSQTRAARAAQVSTMSALVERREDRRRARSADARQTSDVLRAARAQIGDGYAYGGSGPDGFDCSGLTMYAFARAGVELPHNSHAQADMGRPVKRDDIRRGDLVFFNTAGPGTSHVGIAVSGSRAVSATSSGGVMAHSIEDEYWGGHYVTARRLS